jgi:hypothetical protein
MSHIVSCVYCKEKFDRDKDEYVQTSSRRYAHAKCYLRKKIEDKSLPDLEIINPLDFVTCEYCKKQFNKSKEEFKVINGKYFHKKCAKYEESRELTDKEKLEQYIMNLLNEEYINPRIKKQLNQYVEEFQYSYSGILKALVYFYEVKGNPIEKANGGIGIVPYIYKDAYNYYYSLWLAQQKNEDKEIEKYIPKVIEVHIADPQRNIKKRNLFSFLDKEEGE